MDEMSVVTSQSKEAANLGCIPQSLPTDNCLYFGQVHLNPYTSNHMAQELHSLKPKLTLAKLEK